MSSRKKLTISLVAAALVVVAVVAAVVGVLAAQTQTIMSGFTVSYSAGSNVAANVKASYALTTKKALGSNTVDTSFTEIGTLNIAGSDAAATDLKLKKDNAEVSNTALTFTRDGSKYAIVIKFEFENVGAAQFVATLTPPTFATADNLKITYKGGDAADKWTETLGTVTVGGKTAGGSSETKVYYVQIEVADVDLNVQEKSFNLAWELKA